MSMASAVVNLPPPRLGPLDADQRRAVVGGLRAQERQRVVPADDLLRRRRERCEERILDLGLERDRRGEGGFRVARVRVREGAGEHENRCDGREKQGFGRS
jgi:hypothetical protein